MMIWMVVLRPSEILYHLEFCDFLHLFGKSTRGRCRNEETEIHSFNSRCNCKKRFRYHIDCVTQNGFFSNELELAYDYIDSQPPPIDYWTH